MPPKKRSEPTSINAHGANPRHNKGYAGKPLSAKNAMDLAQEAPENSSSPPPERNASVPRNARAPKVANLPSTLRLAWLLERWNSRRFVLRLFRSAALSLALSESILCFLGASVGRGAVTVVPILTTTLALTMWLTVLAGWFSLGGFIEPSTARFLETRLGQRGQSPTLRARLETQAYFGWLGSLAAVPLFMTTLVALTRVRSFWDGFHVAQTGLLALGVAEIFAVVVLLATRGLRRMKLSHPRRSVLLGLLGCEILRAVEPTLPSLYTFIDQTRLLVLRWSTWT